MKCAKTIRSDACGWLVSLPALGSASTRELSMEAMPRTKGLIFMLDSGQAG